MTTVIAQPGELARSEPTRPRVRAGTTIGVHFVVDCFGFTAISLLPVLAVRHGITPEQTALYLGAGAVTSGAVQPLVAWLSDRFDTRAVGTIGFLIAVVCITALGHAPSFGALLALHAIGSAGVGAFHPASAAAVGQLSGRRRSLGLSLFFLAGMLGGITGNVSMPHYVDFFSQRPGGDISIVHGLLSLQWLLIPGLLACGALALAIHRTPHRSDEAVDAHLELSPVEQSQRWRALWILYAGNIIRFNVNMALVYVVVEWTQRLAAERYAGLSAEVIGVEATKLNGVMQAAMQVGMGVGGIGLGFLLSARYEKAAFVLVPLLGAASIVAIPYADLAPDALIVPLAFGATVLAGIGFGSVIPVSLALGQRLLPHRTSLASGLMLGGAWAFGFLGPKLAQLVHTGRSLEAACFATAGALLLAGLISLALPGRLLRTLGH